MSYLHTKETRKYGDSHMDADSDNMSQSTTTEYTQRSRPIRRKVSMATRRRSQLLYLEKYGLDQPNWHTSHDNYDDDIAHDNSSNIHNEQAYSNTYTQEPEPMDVYYDTKKQSRPVSIRNAAQVTSMQKRPARFVKPQKSYSNSLPAHEFDTVHQLIEAYTDKLYIEGYLQKRNDLNTNGSPCGSKKWSLWYVELCGPVLTLWDAEKQKGDVYPQYINITDSTVSHENRLTAETKNHLFSLNSAGANRYLLQATDEKALYRWIRAIRLSCFECARIQEIYTKAFISRPQFQSFWSCSPSSTEGTVQVRFPGTTGWKTYWAVASNRKIEKRLFNKKVVPTNGQIMFFESRKAKYPMMALEHVVQAYTVYPESPKLIQMATLFKIEGSLFKRKPSGHEMQLISNSSSALIMTSDTNDLARWLIGVFDAFRLYGRPEKLIDDPKNPCALNFAEMCHTRLFLDTDEVDSVDASYGTTLMSNKKEYTALLLDKVIRGIPPMEPKQEKIETPNFSLTSEQPSLNQLQTSSEPVISTIEQIVPTKDAYSSTHLRKVTCASDISDSDEESEEQKEETDSDDESLYRLSLKPPIAATAKEPSRAMKPMTPNTSKSGSEVSEVSPTKLSLTTDMIMDDDFVNSILNETESLFSEPPKSRKSNRATETGKRKGSMANGGQAVSDSEGSYFSNGKNRRSIYSQQRANSMMPLTSYGSASSVNVREPTSSRLQHHHTTTNVHSSHWETSSMDARMTHGSDSFYSMPHYASQSAQFLQPHSNNIYEDEDDNAPLFAQNSLLDQAQSQTNQGLLSKKLENQARASGQPLVHVSSNSYKKSTATPRTGLLGIISEKEERGKQANNYAMSMVDEQAMRERMMMGQQQMMMQQYMQAPFAESMMLQQPQMMMPMMDPRAMPLPMMSPHWMQPPMMMYNPQFMIPQMMSSQTSLQTMPQMLNHSRPRTQDSNLKSNRRYNHIPSSVSVDHSVASNSRTSTRSRHTARKHS